MAVTFYSSEDAGAPQYRTSGLTVGKNNITEILDAVLVTGYGSKPGCGWTKVMSSDINDRTVYRNRSAHQNDMHLIVQSHPSYHYTSLWQAADSVVSPEEYYGYSAVAGIGQNYGVERWIAIGDERTLVFAVVNNNVNSSHYYIYGPSFVYAGDFEPQGNDHPSAWGVISPRMYAGKIDAAPNGYGCGVLYNILSYQNTAPRPMTTVPGQEWSEDNIEFHCTNLMLGRDLQVYWPSKTAGYMDVNEFIQKASMRSPWFLIIENDWIYRLRGTYSITPELFYWDKNNGYPNHLKPFTIDDIDYIASGAWNSVYFQTSGEW